MKHLILVKHKKHGRIRSQVEGIATETFNTARPNTDRGRTDIEKGKQHNYQSKP